ncbi:eukaryotic rRNA processing [Paraphysoderma sedebokerense]|nr:eukaryotic rRNA processing [Paraphysoderma sedebokerense]
MAPVETLTSKPAFERQSVNNKEAMLQILEEIRFPDQMPFLECLSMTSTDVISIEDVNDDLTRELAFHNQAHEAAINGRSILLDLNVPFHRPDDYFAEMLKTDNHMSRVRQKLLEEAEQVKKSEEARKLREMKKFGKKGQQEVLKDRKDKEKELKDKVKSLKRKRNEDSTTTFEEEFDIAVSDDDNEKGGPGTKKSRKNKKRETKNAKYGFGGAKRHKKSNTAESSADFTFSAKKMKSNAFIGGESKGKKKRLGKSRRMKSKK